MRSVRERPETWHQRQMGRSAAWEETCQKGKAKPTATSARRSPTFLCQLALSVIVACVACRNEPANSSPGPETPVGTTNVSVQPVISQPANLKVVAANPLAGCDMCHLDIADKLANGKHLANGVGCTTCHGPSKGHVADEINEVKPDRTFARAEVDAFCSQCHKCTRPTTAEPATTSPTERKVCIDCHNPH